MYQVGGNLEILIIAFVSSYLFSLTVDLGRTLFEVCLNFLKKENGVELTSLEAAFVIPCYNSESVILETVRTLGKGYKVYCVANGCTDNTVTVLAGNTSENLEILTSEKGKIRAIIKGTIAAKKAGYTHVVLLDDDIEWPGGGVFVSSKDVPSTALPVVPTSPKNWIHAFQCLEYQSMVVSKRGQSSLGNTYMASGAAGVYRIDTLLEVLKHHDGEHVGDDLQCSFLHHKMGLQVDFFSSPVVRTHPPGTFSEWFKQRAKRWEISPVYNFPLLFRIIFSGVGKGPGWWIRLIVSYRLIVIINDVLRLFSLPMVLIYTPKIVLGLFAITWFGLSCKIFVYRICYRHYPVNWDRLSLGWILFYPIYGVLTWFTRLYALPKGLKMLWVGYIKGKRVTLKTTVEDELQ